MRKTQFGSIASFLLGIILASLGWSLMLNEEDDRSYEAVDKNLVEMTMKTKDDFAYLVSAKAWSDEWTMVMKQGDIGFSMDFGIAPWGPIRYQEVDLSATDGNSGPNGLQGIFGYQFCAGRYYCKTGEGMGFDVFLWNPNYIRRAEEPDFYLKNGSQPNGHVLLLENEDYIVTYKPYKYQGCQADPESQRCKEEQAKINDEVVSVVKTLKFF